MRLFAKSALAGLTGVALAAGCTTTPDPCVGYPQACLAVTVASGPADTYQLLVGVLDGFGSTSPLTPRREPTEPLVYPLRFAIRFAQFADGFAGSVRFTVETLNATGDSTGYLLETVAINGVDHVPVSVAIGPLPASTDMAEPGPPDLAQADAGAQDAGSDLRP